MSWTSVSSVFQAFNARVPCLLSASSTSPTPHISPSARRIPRPQRRRLVSVHGALQFTNPFRLLDTLSVLQDVNPKDYTLRWAWAYSCQNF